MIWSSRAGGFIRGPLKQHCIVAKEAGLEKRIMPASSRNTRSTLETARDSPMQSPVGSDASETLSSPLVSPLVSPTRGSARRTAVLPSFDLTGERRGTAFTVSNSTVDGAEGRLPTSQQSFPMRLEANCMHGSKSKMKTFQSHYGCLNHQRNKKRQPIPFKTEGKQKFQEHRYTPKYWKNQQNG
eukprot:3004248-Amphidinium_carterae.1